MARAEVSGSRAPEAVGWGRPAVKLSDNYSKAMGPAAEIERYRRIFGDAGMAEVPVVA